MNILRQDLPRLVAAKGAGVIHDIGEYGGKNEFVVLEQLLCEFFAFAEAYELDLLISLGWGERRLVAKKCMSEVDDAYGLMHVEDENICVLPDCGGLKQARGSVGPRGEEALCVRMSYGERFAVLQLLRPDGDDAAAGTKNITEPRRDAASGVGGPRSKHQFADTLGNADNTGWINGLI